MDFGTISYSTIASLSFNLIKRLILAWKNRKHTKLLIIPTDEIKMLISRFLQQNSEYLIVDMDNVMAYLDFDENEDITKFKNNKVIYRRMIKKFQQYMINEYGDENIIYITSKTDNIDLFNNKVVLIPTKIYESLKEMTHDEIYELKTTGVKKVLFSNDNDILTYIQRLIS
jgi:hypothetical protein